ncbi:MAG: peroxiredoxin [Deltaproteobacteria bacterium]|nr:peroxiredoxin [Deltaproteobacteria bacterium]
MLEVGTTAPDFCLDGIDAAGQEKQIRLSSLLGQGQYLVLYFYPKDSTPGCTQEACDFRDSFNRIRNKAIVIGISQDSLASHRKFKEKNSLNFPLLSDPGRQVLESYQVWGEKKQFGKTSLGVIRSTYLIGPDGVIKKVWTKVKVKGHVDEVIEAI